MSLLKKIRNALREDAPANSIGAGQIPGAGVAAEGKPEGFGEPGVSKKNQKKHRNKLLRRKPPSLSEEADEAEFSMPKPEMGKFAGHPTFIVPHDVFLDSRLAKKERGWWKNYIGNEEHYVKNIRDYANRNPNKPIYLECARTGSIHCARYGKK